MKRRAMAAGAILIVMGVSWLGMAFHQTQQDPANRFLLSDSEFWWDEWAILPKLPKLFLFLGLLIIVCATFIRASKAIARRRPQT
jgi:hypothetical protein